MRGLGAQLGPTNACRVVVARTVRAALLTILLGRIACAKGPQLRTRAASVLASTSRWLIVVEHGNGFPSGADLPRGHFQGSAVVEHL